MKAAISTSGKSWTRVPLVLVVSRSGPGDLSSVVHCMHSRNPHNLRTQLQLFTDVRVTYIRDKSELSSNLRVTYGSLCSITYIIFEYASVAIITWVSVQLTRLRQLQVCCLCCLKGHKKWRLIRCRGRAWIAAFVNHTFATGCESARFSVINSNSQCRTANLLSYKNVRGDCCNPQDVFTRYFKKILKVCHALANRHWRVDTVQPHWSYIGFGEVLNNKREDGGWRREELEEAK